MTSTQGRTTGSRRAGFRLVGTGSGAAGTRTGERRGLVLAYLVFGVFWGAWAAVLPAVERQVSATDGALGLALGAIAVSAVPVMPLAGRLVDRRGADRALPACLLVFAALLWLPGLAHSLPVLLGALVLLGVATGALDVVVNTATAGWERVEQDRLMSTGHGAFSVGVLLGSATAGVARQFGATPLSVLLVVAVLVALVGLAQPAYRRPQAEPDQVAGRRLPLFLLAVGALTAGAFLCEDGLVSWSALQLERGLGATPAVSGLGPGLFSAAMAAGRLGGGLLGHRLRDSVLVAVSGSGLAVGVLVLAVAPSIPVALAGLLLAGAGTSVLAPVLYGAVGRRAAPGRQGADLAVVTSLGYVGFVAGPPLIGLLSSVSSLPAALGLLSVLGVALAALAPRAVRRTAAGPV